MGNYWVAGIGRGQMLGSHFSRCPNGGALVLSKLSEIDGRLLGTREIFWVGGIGAQS